MTNTQALLLTGAITLPAIPWLGVAIIGIALLSAGSERSTWKLYHVSSGSGDVCYIVNFAQGAITDIEKIIGKYDDVRLIGEYETRDAAVADATMICGERIVG